MSRDIRIALVGTFYWDPQYYVNILEKHPRVKTVIEPRTIEELSMAVERGDGFELPKGTDAVLMDARLDIRPHELFPYLGEEPDYSLRSPKSREGLKRDLLDLMIKNPSDPVHANIRVLGTLFESDIPVALLENDSPQEWSLDLRSKLALWKAPEWWNPELRPSNLYSTFSEIAPRLVELVEAKQIHGLE